MKNQPVRKTIFGYAMKAFIHDSKPNLALAAALTFILVLGLGSLTVGSSVKESLRKNSLSRLGAVQTVVSLSPGLSGNRIMEFALKGIAFAYRLPASARTNEGRTTGVILYVCTPEFYQLLSLKKDHVYANESVVRALAISGETEFFLSIRQSSEGPALLTAGKADLQMMTFPLRAQEILSDNGPGGFTEAVSQQAPRNVFMPADLFFKTNALDPIFNLCVSSQLENGKLADLITKAITAEDLGWQKTVLSDGSIQITQKDLFFTPPSSPEVSRFFSWFLLDASNGLRHSPFAFVVGREEGPGRGGIWINQELANDLELAPGDTVDFAYYVPGANGTLETRQASRKVEKILPMEGLGADRLLALDIPGFTDSVSCSAWDTGFDIDLSKVRPEDELYWKRYGGSPKIIFEYSDAVSLFPNPWGSTTAIRLSGLKGEETVDEAADTILADYVRSFSLSERYPAQVALSAAAQGMDFGSLFFGLSFFIFIAVIIMTGVLIQMRLQGRVRHVRLFSAWGSRRSQILKLESLQMGIVLLCTFIGALVLTPLYSYGVLLALSTVWKQAVASASLRMSIDWIQVVIIAVILLVAFLVVYTAIFLYRTGALSRKKKKSRGNPYGAILSVIMTLPALIVIVQVKSLGLYGYFLSAFLMLILFLACFNCLLVFMAFYFEKNPARGPWILTMVRKRKTILLATGILAFSLYSLGAVSGYFQKLEANSIAAVTGTGGWDFWVQTALPVDFDPATGPGRQRAGIKLEQDATVSAMRIYSGDEAGCLNLNRAFLPSIAGVESEVLGAEDRFGFADLGGKKSAAEVWRTMALIGEDGTVPVLAGAETMSWSLYLKTGDTIDYPLPDGRALKLRIVAALSVTVFEGYLVMDRALMESLNIGVDSFNLFLVRAHALDNQSVDEAFQLYGPQTIDTVNRVNSYLGLQNSYLLIFAVLGFAGLFLGTLALALLTLRDILGRRKELFILQAKGIGGIRLSLFASFPFMISVSLGLFGGVGVVLGASALYAGVVKSAIAPGFFALLTILVWVAGSATVWWCAAMAIKSFIMNETGKDLPRLP